MKINDLNNGALNYLVGLKQGYDAIWSPMKGAQWRAFSSKADIIFYGGGAGGGKTDLVIGAAILNHANSIIFRREYPQIKSIINRCAEIMGNKDGYNGQEKVWRLPAGNSLEFGACQYEDDVTRYQGRPHDLKAFDEITHFTESQFRYLGGWLRTAEENQECRIICTGNPPTNSQGQWVKEFWSPWFDPKHPNPAEDGELRWFATIDGKDVECDNSEPFEHKGDIIIPKSRTFIKALVDDNEYLMATGYKQTLQALPEPLRSQMLYGDFMAGATDHEWQLIPTAWINAAVKRYHEMQGAPSSLDALGVDVSRGGADDTVMCPRYGLYFPEPNCINGDATADGEAVANHVVDFLSQCGNINAQVNIDVIGVGASVYDFAKRKLTNVTPFNAGGKAVQTDKTGKFKFKNLRAYVGWKLREELDPEKGSDIAISPEYVPDLVSYRYKVVNDKIQLEPKDDTKKRIGRSPDKGDALMYSLYEEIKAKPRVRYL